MLGPVVNITVQQEERDAQRETKEKALENYNKEEEKAVLRKFGEIKQQTTAVESTSNVSLKNWYKINI